MGRTWVMSGSDSVSTFRSFPAILMTLCDGVRSASGQASFTPRHRSLRLTKAMSPTCSELHSRIAVFANLIKSLAWMIIYMMVLYVIEYEYMPTHALHSILPLVPRPLTIPRLLRTIPRLIIYKDNFVIILSLPSPLTWWWLPTRPRTITSPRMIPRCRILP